MAKKVVVKKSKNKKTKVTVSVKKKPATGNKVSVTVGGKGFKTKITGVPFNILLDMSKTVSSESNSSNGGMLLMDDKARDSFVQIMLSKVMKGYSSEKENKKSNFQSRSPNTFGLTESDVRKVEKMADNWERIEHELMWGKEVNGKNEGGAVDKYNKQKQQRLNTFDSIKVTNKWVLTDEEEKQEELRFERHIKNLSARIERYAKKNLPEEYNYRSLRMSSNYADASANSVSEHSKNYKFNQWVVRTSDELLESVEDYVDKVVKQDKKGVKEYLKKNFNNLVKFDTYFSVSMKNDFDFYDESYSKFLKTGKVYTRNNEYVDPITDENHRIDISENNRKKGEELESMFFNQEGTPTSLINSSVIRELANTEEIELKKYLADIREQEKGYYKEMSDLLEAEMSKVKIGNIKNKRIHSDLSRDGLRKRTLGGIKRTPGKKGHNLGKSALMVKGVKALFSPEFEIIERTLASGEKKVLKLINPAFEHPVYRVKRLEPVKIPEEVIKGRLIMDKYPSVAAAIFFQLLVSNTPLDEDYWYTREVKYKPKEKKLDKDLNKSLIQGYENILNNTHNVSEGFVNKLENLSSLITDRRDEEFDRILENNQERTYKIRAHHKADSESVRYDWILHFKGMDFSARDFDKDFENLYFEKGKNESIKKIADYLYEATKKSKTKSIGFTYTNNNPRWEQLEYGYYETDSGERKGSRYAHGVKGGYSYQAPNGFVRITEAMWDMYKENGKVAQIVSNYLNGKDISMDVSAIGKDLIKELKNHNRTIGTNNLDYENFVIVKE